MRILMLHNRYKTRGGEDESTEAEISMLEKAGHQVDYMEQNNDAIDSLKSQASAAIVTIWSRSWYYRLKEILNVEQYDVVHVQNSFPLISPSVYYAASARRVPVVQSIRNYRLVCPSHNFYRNQNVCRDCVGTTFKHPGVVHKCYRNSAAGTAVIALMSGVHKIAGTWQNKVQMYLAVSNYVADALIEDGFPPERIQVKANFVSLQRIEPIVPMEDRRHILFVGRLVPEKGLDLLIEAYQRISTALPLKIVGEGPQSLVLSAGVELLGKRPLLETYQLMRHAVCVVMPGRWPEPFGRVAIEAFAQGTPVVSSDVGGVRDIVDDNENGFLFRAGEVSDLTLKLSKILALTEKRLDMAHKAREKYLRSYTPEVNLPILMNAYEKVIATGNRD